MKMNFYEKVFTVISLSLFALTIYAVLFGIYIPTERNGEHTGYITATQSDYWGNYNIYFKTDLESSQEDAYCIRKGNPALVDKAREHQKSRELVTVSYTGYFIQRLSDCNYQILEDIN